MKRYRWNLLAPDDETVQALTEAINVSQPVARALCNRGVTTFDAARDYFRSSIEHIPSPFLMQQMQRAVDRVLEAVRMHEKIMIYGDYDVDGTTGTAMLFLFLKEQGAEVTWYINDRFTEGYGLSAEGIDTALGRQVSLVITVDCGIRANREIKRCGELGIDVIVCDHHEPDELPTAYAILNPKVPGSTYPFRELCGCGVAFKLLQAIAGDSGADDESWQKYLDFVAIATAADMVALEQENRTLVREGLKRMRVKPRGTFKALFSLMKVASSELGMFHIAFGIAPRINAAGRMGSAHLAMEWLVSESMDDSVRHAGELDRMNALRREIDSDIMTKAEKMVESHFASYCSSIVLYDESWHLGVLGIVASKMLEKHYLPTVILGSMNGFIKGSVRSIEGFNIYEALQECSAYLEQFGGHHQAAGVILRPENLAGFRKKFNEVCAASLSIEQQQKALAVDALLPLEEITPNFINVLAQFAPLGYGNREPLFMSRELQLFGTPRLLSKRHVKFSVRDSAGRIFDVIGFDRPDIFDQLSTQTRPVFVMLYSVEKRMWNNREQIQIRLRDLELCNKLKS
ncbi:single-stranded-DNA-specific exonuclease RecJ [Chlorobium ferrooxidans]|uniref:Single-stranded-DNA-specific exonuclease RecJ n=1 Tax=Chlorobium ferrooxidans DSM 13031 TaxID=377431 RepID=Q0YUR3_9CHLB|nr:single-stranded-DNA-specific exonuclease RecJ [Chlorobium ferrooxidans]EAT59970.1 single-stranded-DNA-specific exonuclease RecJ [Chlorobium ferrooxidans DSM 13031]